MAKAQRARVRSDVFFEKELAGEPPLTRPTAERLVAASRQFEALAPWNELEEVDLILLERAEGEPDCCSVMGSIGEFRALAVYRGIEGLRWFDNAQRSRFTSRGDAFRSWRTLQAEFLTAKDLKPQDKRMLQELEPESKRGSRVSFRSFRPGYHPWFINEDEARLLTEALDAVRWFVDNLQRGAFSDCWEYEGAWPYVRKAEGAYSVRMNKLPAIPHELPRPVSLDMTRIAALRENATNRIDQVELGVVDSAISIGKPSQRPAAARIVLMAEPTTGMIVHVDADVIRTSEVEQLGASLLNFVESTRILPQAVVVANEVHKAALSPLAKALDAKIEVRPLLAVEIAAAAMPI